MHNCIHVTLNFSGNVHPWEDDNVKCHKISTLQNRAN